MTVLCVPDTQQEDLFHGKGVGTPNDFLKLMTREDDVSQDYWYKKLQLYYFFDRFFARHVSYMSKEC